MSAPPPASRGRRAGAAVAVALVLSAALALALRRSATERDVSVESFATASPSRVPVLAFRGRERAPGAPIAVLVHGFQCNKAMMAPLAKHLALNGVDAYAIDLPGHGASPERYADARLAPAVAEALEDLVRRAGARREDVFLVGHSWGATVLARVLGADGAWRAAAFLGPGEVSGLSPSAPRDLLLVTAGRDYGFVVENARRIARETGIDPPSAAGPPADAVPGAAGAVRRAWRVVPGAGHVGLLLAPEAHRTVLGWIASARSAPRAPERRPATAETIALAALVPLALAALSLLLSPAPAAAPSPPPARGLFLLAAAWTVALAAVHRVVPLAALRLHEGEVLASLLLLAGLLAVALGLALERGARLPPPRDVARGLPAALAGAGALYLWAAALVERDLYGLLLTPRRAALAAVLACAALPFFACLEGSLPPRGWRRALSVCAAWAFFALTLAALRIRLERFGPAVFAFGVVAGGLATAIRARSTAGGAAAFSALAAGWIVAAGFIGY